MHKNLFVCCLFAVVLSACEAFTTLEPGPTAPTTPTTPEPSLPARASDGGRLGTTNSVPSLGTFNKRLGVVTLAVGGQPGNTVRIEVSVRDHECEDGDNISVRVERSDSWERVFDGEIFNRWQTRYVGVTVGYHYTILAYANNGTGFKGSCGHQDENTGEMFVGHNDRGKTVRWNAPGGGGSVGVVNIVP